MTSARARKPDRDRERFRGEGIALVRLGLDAVRARGPREARSADRESSRGVPSGRAGSLPLRSAEWEERSGRGLRAGLRPRGAGEPRLAAGSSGSVANRPRTGRPEGEECGREAHRSAEQDAAAQTLQGDEGHEEAARPTSTWAAEPRNGGEAAVLRDRTVQAQTGEATEAAHTREGAARPREGEVQPRGAAAGWDANLPGRPVLHRTGDRFDRGAPSRSGRAARGRAGGADRRGSLAGEGAARGLRPTREAGDVGPDRSTARGRAWAREAGHRSLPPPCLGNIAARRRRREESRCGRPRSQQTRPGSPVRG